MDKSDYSLALEAIIQDNPQQLEQVGRYLKLESLLRFMWKYEAKKCISFYITKQEEKNTYEEIIADLAKDNDEEHVKELLTFQHNTFNHNVDIHAGLRDFLYRTPSEKSACELIVKHLPVDYFDAIRYILKVDSAFSSAKNISLLAPFMEAFADKNLDFIKENKNDFILIFLRIASASGTNSLFEIALTLDKEVTLSLAKTPTPVSSKLIELIMSMYSDYCKYRYRPHKQKDKTEQEELLDFERILEKFGLLEVMFVQLEIETYSLVSATGLRVLEHKILHAQSNHDHDKVHSLAWQAICYCLSETASEHVKHTLSILDKLKELSAIIWFIDDEHSGSDGRALAIKILDNLQEKAFVRPDIIRELSHYTYRHELLPSKRKDYIKNLLAHLPITKYRNIAIAFLTDCNLDELMKETLSSEAIAIILNQHKISPVELMGFSSEKNKPLILDIMSTL